MNPAFFQITLKLFLIKEGQFLVLRDRKSGFGDLPGGRLGEKEIYEPLTTALAREVGEELGDEIQYMVSDEPAFIFPMKMWSGGYEALGIAFVGFYDSGEIDLSDEHDHMEWVDLISYDPADLFSEHMLDAVRKFLTMVRSGAIPILKSHMPHEDDTSLPDTDSPVTD